MTLLKGNCTSNVDENTINFFNAPNIPKALVKTFIENKGNESLIDILHGAIAHRSTNQESDIEESLQVVRRDFVNCGICEVIMSFVKNVLNSNTQMTIIHVSHTFGIISFLIDNPENIPSFISAGLMEVLVQYFNSPLKHMDGYSVYYGWVSTERYFDKIVRDLCNYDNNMILINWVTPTKPT